MDVFSPDLAAVIREIAAEEGMKVVEMPEKHDVVLTFLNSETSDNKWGLDFEYFPVSPFIQMFVSMHRKNVDTGSHRRQKSSLQSHPNLFSGAETTDMMYLDGYPADIAPEAFREKVKAYICSARAVEGEPGPYYRCVGGSISIPFLAKAQRVHPWPHNPKAIHLPDGPVEFPPDLAAVIREIAENRNLEMTTYPERWGVCEIELMGETNYVTWDAAFMYSPRLKEVGVSLFAYGWQAEKPPERSFLSRMFRRAMGVQETVKSRYECLEHIDLPPLPEDIPPEAFKEEVLAAIGKMEEISMTLEAAPPPVSKQQNRW